MSHPTDHDSPSPQATADRSEQAALALRLSGVRFSYDYPGAGQPWLIDIPRLELPADEQMLLRGGSGRGKSTLLQLIAGLRDPHEGSIEVAGRDITTLQGAKRDEYRGQTIGMIFQTFNLLHGFSALENVMIALMFSTFNPREHESYALELLGTLGIERPRASVDELSVGQQQRIAVARAVACRPALVLADEPTASLDPENAEIAMDLIQQCCRDVGAALLCTSHDPSMVSRFSNTLEFDALSHSATSSPPLASASQ